MSQYESFRIAKAGHSMMAIFNLKAGAGAHGFDKTTLIRKINLMKTKGVDATIEEQALKELQTALKGRSMKAKVLSALGFF